MKINMYGGALTISYSIAKHLRARGQDVTLFIDKELSDKSYAPSWEDEEMRGGYPGWIKITEARFLKAIFGDRRSVEFTKKLSDCDILHLHGEAYLWMNLVNKPFLYQSHGYDLDQMPFNRGSVKQVILSMLARRAMGKAASIITIPHQRDFLERLGLAEKESYLPYPVDIDKYAPVNADELKKKILSENDAELIFFHPSRHEWLNNPTTNNKGNDKVITAFASYVRRHGRKAVLILVNKGRNVRDSKKMIGELGISERVVWLEAVPKSRLISYYNASDIILDQFNLGSFGQIFLEAMACGVPTFAYLKRYEGVYPEMPPAVNVYTDMDIERKLLELSEDSKKRKEIGQESRDWVRKYHNLEYACDKYIALYNSFMEKHARC
jgi:glycosyltransferase involved in cell wall biosynthesis